MKREPRSCPEPTGEQRRVLPEITFTGQQPGEESVEIITQEDEQDTPSRCGREA